MGLCWVGHFFLKKITPATFLSTRFSLASDFILLFFDLS